MSPVRNTKAIKIKEISNGINKNLYTAIVLFLISGIFCYSAAAAEADKDFSAKSGVPPNLAGMRKNMQNPFGVLEFLHWSHPWNNNKYSRKEDLIKVVALMKQAGAAYVRMDFLWEDIEPKEGQFEFAKYDYIVDLLNKNNINILGLLDYSASWASPEGLWNYPPENNKLFLSYALRVIERYKDKVKYWEVWNEPDSSAYWRPQDGLKSYCRLLKDVYLAAKRIDPDCRILNGGLAQGLSSVNRLYDNGAKDYFDILNIHIFENPLNQDSIKAVVAYPRLAYKIMSRNGDAHKNIWVTEIGCPGVKRGQEERNWWMGKNPDERQQALWVKEVFTELLKQGYVNKIFWAFFRDCNSHWSNGIDYFGLIRWDFSRKPSFKAYKECFSNWKKSR